MNNLSPVYVLGAVYVYTSVAGEWSLLQTLNGTSADSNFGGALSYSPSGNQLAVGAYVTTGNTNGKILVMTIF